MIINQNEMCLEMFIEGSAVGAEYVWPWAPALKIFGDSVVQPRI